MIKIIMIVVIIGILTVIAIRRQANEVGPATIVAVGTAVFIGPLVVHGLLALLAAVLLIETAFAKGWCKKSSPSREH